MQMKPTPSASPGPGTVGAVGDGGAMALRLGRSVRRVRGSAEYPASGAQWDSAGRARRRPGPLCANQGSGGRRRAGPERPGGAGACEPRVRCREPPNGEKSWSRLAHLRANGEDQRSAATMAQTQGRTAGLGRSTSTTTPSPTAVATTTAACAPGPSTGPAAAHHQVDGDDRRGETPAGTTEGQQAAQKFSRRTGPRTAREREEERPGCRW